MFSNNNSSEESDVSDTFADTKSTFRIGVCLQQYFEDDDVRVRSYVLVTRKRKVHWLQKRIQKLFSLPGTFCLFFNNRLLPPSEPLGLLSPEDCIEVVPLLKESDKENSGQAVIKENASKLQNEEKQGLVSFDISDNGQNDTETMNNSDLNRPKIIELHSNDSVDGVKVSIEEGDKIKTNTLQHITFYEKGQTLQSRVHSDDTLNKLKRRAFSMLEGHCGHVPEDMFFMASGPPPRRVRHRVRRRTRHAVVSDALAVAAPATAEAPDAGDAPGDAGDAPGDVGHAPGTAGDAPGDSAAGRHDTSEGPAASGDVARNEEACARQPRIVHSLDNDMT